MRQSMGTLWIFSIVITFITIFASYLAITLNYAKAFKIKNHIISLIENREGITDDSDIANWLDDYLLSSGYNAYGDCRSITDQGEENWVLVEADIYPNDSHTKNGVCIFRKDAEEASRNGFCKKNYYRVVTFFKFDVPVVGNLLTFSVKGNTSPVYDLANNENCVH